MSIDWWKAAAEQAEHGTLGRDRGRLSEQHDLAHDQLGFVRADVRELLGTDAPDVARQVRDQQRDALGDAARVDAGAVQRHAAFPARAFDLRLLATFFG
jgi:hypothetical protein